MAVSVYNYIYIHRLWITVASGLVRNTLRVGARSLVQTHYSFKLTKGYILCHFLLYLIQHAYKVIIKAAGL